MSANKLPENQNDDRSIHDTDGLLIARMRSSLLPPPEEMQQYEQLYTGITKELIETYKLQVSHRIELESAVITENNKRASRAQIFAFIISLMVIAGGFVLIFLGKDLGGFSLVLGALATLIAVFFGGKAKNRKELKNKSQKISELQ